MFHWLKAVGGRMEDRFEMFEDYQGKASYRKLGLEVPTPMEKDEDGSEWSHMSDYDDMGWSPINEREHIEPSEGTTLVNPSCEGPHRVRDHASGTQKEEDHVDNVHEIQVQKNDAHLDKHNGRSQTAMGNTQAMRGTTAKNHHAEIQRESARVEEDLNHKQHVETFRDTTSHVELIHEGSEERESGTTTWSQTGDGKVITAWCSAEQHYRVTTWSTLGDNQSEAKYLAPLMLGASKQRTKRPQLRDESDDEESDFEDSRLLCNMIGEGWQNLPFPVITDSGACALVMPVDWCTHVEITRTPESKAKEFFRAANGHKIYNEGQ